MINKIHGFNDPCHSCQLLRTPDRDRPRPQPQPHVNIIIKLGISLYGCQVGVLVYKLFAELFFVGTSYKTTTICQAGHSLCRDKSLKKFSVGRDAGSSLEIVSVPLKSGRLAAMPCVAWLCPHNICDFDRPLR